MAVKKETATLVEIKPRNVKLIPIKIIGDTPLIVHAWSHPHFHHIYTFYPVNVLVDRGSRIHSGGV